MITSLMIFHAVISVLLIVMVLLQFGKGAEAGLLSGGAGGGDSMNIKPRGNALSRITIVLAVLFIGNSVLLARLQTTTATSSLLEQDAPIRPLSTDQPTLPMDGSMPVEQENREGGIMEETEVVD